MLGLVLVCGTVHAAPTQAQLDQCGIEARSVRNIQSHRGQPGYETVDKTIDTYKKYLHQYATEHGESAEIERYRVGKMYALVSYAWSFPATTTSQELYDIRYAVCTKWAAISNRK
jgi:hypothetical protein